MNRKEDYERLFHVEQRVDYPAIAAFEQRQGFAVPRPALEAAARVLACPVKVNPPNWQHGRVIYARLRRLLEGSSALDAGRSAGRFVDIGTAKGFSAVMMSWAMVDAATWAQRVVSIDVVDPLARIGRNSVGEIGGFKTVPEFVAPFAATGVPIDFVGCESLEWLDTAVANAERIRFAFIDGKHSYGVVKQECTALLALQQRGDVAIFDDLQIPAVAAAVRELRGYEVELLDAAPAMRRYAIAVRR